MKFIVTLIQTVHLLKERRDDVGDKVNNLIKMNK